MNAPKRLGPLLCSYCFHPLHEGYKCTQCKCKGKPTLWRKFTDAVANWFDSGGEPFK